MKHLISRYAILLLCIAASGAALMQTSQRVQEAENRQSALEKEMERERRRIAVLEAEWSYLNAPQRLEILAEEVLDLSGAENGKMVGHIRSLPEGFDGHSPVFVVPQPILYKTRKPERGRR